ISRWFQETASSSRATSASGERPTTVRSAVRAKECGASPLEEIQSRGSIVPRLNPGAGGLVAVVVRLVGPLDGDAEVGRLLRRQRGQGDAQHRQVQAGDLLVEVRGEDVDGRRPAV